MAKQSIFIGLDRFYQELPTGYSALPFVYNNILTLKGSLEAKLWTTTIPLIEEDANKENIIKNIKEAIGVTGENGWLLVYYSGHATKYFFSDSSIPPKTYCATYTTQLTAAFTPPLSVFLSEDDYGKIVVFFEKSCPQGHLITILDCCYAFGLINNFSGGQSFHTVIAAAAADTSAGFDDNSAFFKAFQQCWDLQFDALEDAINNLLSGMGAPNLCVVTPAEKFKDKTLNSSI